jgi:glycosyltransferase involved in cell wall biosynthesis
MTWFIKDIFPLIRAEVPGAKLVITGDHANLPLPATDNVTLTGFVEDIRPLVANSMISIAPLLQGGGTRLKILESMALRTPVVATPKGAEGLDVVHGENILIAETAKEYADAAIRLMTDPDLRHRLVENGYQLVKEKYDWSVVMPQFLGLITKVADQKAFH